MSTDFDAQMAQAFQAGRPEGEGSATPKRKRAPKKAKEKVKEKRPRTVEVQEEEDPLVPDPPETDEAYEGVVRTALRYCDAFPEHAGDTRARVSSGGLPLADVQLELDSITRRVNSQHELTMMRSGLVTGCAGIEFGASFIPGQPVKLAGFSESVSASIESFDTCLKQLLCKFGNEYVMSVEATMGLMLAKHAVTTHMANEREGRKEHHPNTPRPWVSAEPPVVVDPDPTGGPDMEAVD